MYSIYGLGEYSLGCDGAGNVHFDLNNKLVLAKK